VASIDASLLPTQVGLNVHSDYAAYKNRLPALLARLAELYGGSTKGVWLRDNAVRGAAVWKNLGFEGHVLTVVGTTANAQLAYDSGSDAVDPVNEINVLDTAAKQTALDIGATMAGKLPVIATSIANITGTKADSLGYQPNAVRANAHCYRGMQPQPAWGLKQAEYVRQSGKAASGKSTWATETGYHDYLVPGKLPTYKGAENSNHQLTPDATAASTIVSDLQAFFANGVERVFLYELVDQWKYRTVDGSGDHEGYFGLLREDLTWKLHGSALRDWLGSLKPPVQQSTTPWAVPISPDPTARIKADQLLLGLTPDGLLGPATLTGYEKSMEDLADLQRKLADLEAQEDSVAAALRDLADTLSTPEPLLS
jgi:hypothetical protein